MGDVKMTDLEYDLHQNVDYTYYTDGIVVTDVDLNFEKTAENLAKLGYQKIIWHDANKELPELNKYVLGYDYCGQTYAVVSWDNTDWTDDNGICYNVDYWTKLPAIDVRR